MSLAISQRVAFELGRYVSKVHRAIEKNGVLIGSAVLVYPVVETIAERHKLDKTVPDAVEDNLWKCLEFID